MQERLQWIIQKPRHWTAWEPVRGGMEVHESLCRTLGGAAAIVEREPARLQWARRRWQAPWWQPARWRGSAALWQEPAADSQDMVWANMALHLEADPQALLARWHRLLRVDGFVMFSCLGPDTAIELRQLYQGLGAGPCGHELTDMHDWGDMMVHTGFAEPVMDMERLTLTFSSAERLLSELAGLGRNFHRHRFAGLRGRGWKRDLVQAIETQAPRQADGRLSLTVELIYGHALKPQPRIKLGPVSSVPMQDMRRMLRGGGAVTGR